MTERTMGYASKINTTETKIRKYDKACVALRLTVNIAEDEEQPVWI